MYSSRKSATHTSKEPSTGWTENRRSEFWCQSFKMRSILN